MGDNQDISKIIGIIMENPDLIARIKSLADGGGEAKKEEEPASAEKRDATPSTEAVSAVSGEGVTYAKPQSKKMRRELLCALKPYVKSERAKAIDTMLSVIDVIDVMKER